MRPPKILTVGFRLVDMTPTTKDTNMAFYDVCPSYLGTWVPHPSSLEVSVEWKTNKRYCRLINAWKGPCVLYRG